MKRTKSTLEKYREYKVISYHFVLTVVVVVNVSIIKSPDIRNIRQGTAWRTGTEL